MQKLKQLKTILLSIYIVLLGLSVPAAVAISSANSDLYSTTSISVEAQGGDTGFVQDCPPGEISDNCNPPTLQQVEFIAVRLVYFIWGGAGLLFFFFLARAGFIYLYSGNDPGKIEEVRGMIVRWFLGLFLLFFSRPIVATVMSELVGESSACFANLQDPGFTFFFNDVCTEGDQLPDDGEEGDGGDLSDLPDREIPACTENLLLLSACGDSWESWNQICASMCESGLPVNCWNDVQKEYYTPNCNCDTNTCNTLTATGADI